MKLNQHISDLLHKHSCVVVPDFGGFVANYRSAVVDEVRQKIYPPSKSVLFNPHLKDNDGLLGNYVAGVEHTNYATALDMISKEVSGWKQRLSAGERIEIGEVGFLCEENGRIHFEQSREVNLLMQAYGLRSIDFINFKQKVAQPKVETKTEHEVLIQKEVVKEPVAEKEMASKPSVEVRPKKEAPVISLDAKEAINTVALEQANEEDIIPLHRPQRFKTVMKYAAAVVFVPVLFYSYWIPMETDFLETKLIHFSDFNPIHTQIEKSFDKREDAFVSEESMKHQTWEELTENINASVYNYELSEDFYIPILLSNPVEEGSDDIQEEIIESAPVVHGDYHVISGCFSVKANAENKIAELTSQGFSASILDVSGGLHRVTAGGFNSREDADAGLDRLKGAGHSGWILKK